jgi:Ca2+-transporting ATPase
MSQSQTQLPASPSNSTFTGLSEREVLSRRTKFGSNVIGSQESSGLAHTILGIVSEPMFFLLVVSALIYFIVGQTSEGVIMLLALAAVSGISLYQEAKSGNAIKALKDLSSPRAKVVRGGVTKLIDSSELVQDDIFIVTEGEAIPADGRILESNDLAVDESFLTGESFPVEHDTSAEHNSILLGSFVTSGQAVAQVSAVGQATRLGQLGKTLKSIESPKSPLQLQIQRFVRNMAIMGILAFSVVWIYHSWKSGNIVLGLMLGLTLAMSILPEELPVAFSVFMALGARRMSLQRVLARQPQVVETLGSASIICVDKTGTLTKNEMKLSTVYDYRADSVHEITPDSNLSETAQQVLIHAMWASETSPYDPMELAIHSLYGRTASSDDRANAKMIHEYPLSGKLPLMTHVYERFDNFTRFASCKGAPEIILSLCSLPKATQTHIYSIIQELATQGLRVLGVAHSTSSIVEPFPESPKGFSWEFDGLVAFSDPPRDNMSQVIADFYRAGVDVKMITGDYPQTALNIASRIGLRHSDTAVTGAELAEMSSEQFKQSVLTHSILARVSPEMKLKIIEALKSTGEVVAMTGDGVNDGPALKAAHIGVAMGRRGTEVARCAASLVLLDDDLSKMISAIGIGRRIYANLKKAFQYIVSIHIPIVGVVTMPALLGWKYGIIFDPVHVIFLELVMGPTCSIVYENEPMEEQLMSQKPRRLTETFLSWKEMAMSIVQGLAILAGLLLVLYWATTNGRSESLARTMVFTTLVFANIALTLVDRSRILSMWRTLHYKNNLVFVIISITVGLLGLILLVPIIGGVFRFSTPSPIETALCFGAGLASTFWFEGYKFIQRLRRRVLY